MLDPASARRLKLLRFPLIVGVVFSHTFGSSIGMAANPLGNRQAHPVAFFLQNLISNEIARLAVPIFFLMAGHLFFVGLEPSIRSFSAKIQGRFRRLFLPFLFWNLLTLFFLAVTQALPATQRFYSGQHNLIASFGPFNYLNAIFGLTDYPISFQFWFIRDLLVLVLFSPLIYLASRFAGIPLLGLVLLGWLAGKWPVYIPCSRAVLFFSAGAYLAISRRSLFCLDRLGPVLLLPYLMIVAIVAAGPARPFSPYLHQAGILLGVVVLLFASGQIPADGKASKAMKRLGTTSFFVFSVHEPLQTVLAKLGCLAIAPHGSAMITLLYFSIPITVILCSLFLYRGLSLVQPGLKDLLTGRF